MILMDIEMPGENGIETTKIIREMEMCQNTYILGCSGHGEESEKQKCLQSGMNDYMTKPVKFE